MKNTRDLENVTTSPAGEDLLKVCWIEDGKYKYSFSDGDGNLITDLAFDEVGLFASCGVAIVRNSEGWNFIDTDGNILSDEWLDYIEYPISGVAIVGKDGKKNLFSFTENRVVSDEWFDTVEFFDDESALVSIDEKYNLIDNKGNTIYKNWFASRSRAEKTINEDFQ